MDDFIKRNKYDLRETRFSQNYQTSIELINNKDIDIENPILRNTLTSQSPFKIKNSFSSIHHEESFIYTKGQPKSNTDMIKQKLNKIKQKELNSIKFKQSFSYLDDNIMTRDSLGSLDQPVKYESALQYLSNELQQDTSSDKSEQQDVSSEKLSIIRGLQQKLFSLQQKIKASSVPSINPYFEAIKLKVEKDCENFSQRSYKSMKPNFKQTIINDQQMNLLSKVSNKREPEIKYVDKSGTNQSLESESMLLDKEYSTSEKEISTLKENASKILQPEVQIVEIIKVVEVPYLIEVVRENEQKIESKKSFYFEQNEDIHRTFEEFSHKESVNEDMLNIETKIRQQTMNQQQNDFQLEYSGTNIFQNLFQTNDQSSVISINESNRTFHKEWKQRRNERQYNFDEDSQMISKLLTKHNPTSQLEYELEQRLKSVEVQNEQLKDRLIEKQHQNNQLIEENKLLTQELQNLIEFEFNYLQKLKQYQQKLQQSKQSFTQIHQQESQKLKSYYQKIIQQYQNQQSQYANRIISFQQLFQQQQTQSNNYQRFIQKLNQQIIHLQNLSYQKDYQIQNETIKRIQTQRLVIKRQTQLKTLIQNLQKDNSQLQNHIKSIHSRYQSQGFYLLKQQAQQIKKTIQQKDSTHIQELQQLENRYTSIITKYQTQLQTMKKKLQKVKIDKSLSISKTINSQNCSIIQQKNIDKKQDINNFPKRNNILKTQLNCLNSSLKQNQQQTKEIKHLCQLKMRHVKSTEDQLTHTESANNNQNEKQSIKKVQILSSSHQDQNEQKFKELLICEINYLKQENSKLKSDVDKQRQDKQNLSQKLTQISQIMSKQISQLTESESQLDKNQQILQKCVQELQKQYQMNKNLKQELQKTKQIMKNQLKSLNKISQIIDQEQIKLHPTFIQLNKKYIKSKKYIKVLEKQILSLTLLPDFNQQTQKCCQNKDSIIKELKQIAFNKSSLSQTTI